MAGRFFGGIFVILLIYTLIVSLIYVNYDFQDNMLNSFIISALLTTVNISAAFFIIMKVRDKKNNEFYKYFLGSMGIRFAVLIMIIFLVIKFVNIHQIGFLVSLFLLYFIFQFWELIIINKFLNKGINTK
jgi:hypothetical protein